MKHTRLISVSRIQAPVYLEPARVAEWHHNLCDKRAQYYRELAAFQRSIGTGLKPPHRPHAESKHYRNPAVYEALRLMFGSKCAYCEVEVAAAGPHHVEHYRPAARYPGLAYNWDNLLISCPHCNSTYKSDRFPIAPTAYTPQENRLHPCVRTGEGETPFLLNPCLDTPEDHLTFRNGRVIARTQRGHYTIKICGLNRDDLITARQLWLRIVQRSVYEYRIAAMARVELDEMGIPWRSL